MMMGNYSGIGKEEDDEMILPPGFRFHPTDEELITHYLIKKVIDHTFSAKAIGEVDMNRIEPWQLPGLAKMSGKEWYFFCVRDKKYPTGLRTNRATDAGYWKATGKDKEIYRGNSLVGMKKTLVFYKGRAPKGEKTNWVIHEFRLEGKSTQTGPKSTKNEWVICRVFHKSSGEKKVNSGGIGHPQMTESSTSSGSGGGVIKPESLRVPVPCFSNPMNIQPLPNNNILNNPNYQFDHNSQFQFQFPSSYTYHVPNQTYFNGIIRNNGDYQMGKEIDTRSQETAMSNEMNPEISSVMPDFGIGKREFDGDQEAHLGSGGPIDMDNIWNY